MCTIKCASSLPSALHDCQASGHILDKDQEYGKTRSQTRKMSESSDDSKKPAMKRTSTMAQTAKVICTCVFITQQHQNSYCDQILLCIHFVSFESYVDFSNF